MTICEATISDAPMIAAVHRASRRAAMPWLPDLHTPDEDVRFFSTMVLPEQKVRVARHGSGVIGFAAASDGWLNHLYVAPAHWSTGVGGLLLETAKMDFDRLQLWTFQGNEGARRFYKARGFSECELSDGTRNEERMPDVRMRWVRA